MKQYITKSEKETKSLAEKLAKELKGVIALSGELGVGKTIFTQGFAKGLGIKDKIISPTFVLMRQHKIPDSRGTLFHIDLYRLEEKSQILNLGIEEVFADPENIVIIEWAEKATSLLPKEITQITIEKEGQDSRKISISESLF